MPQKVWQVGEEVLAADLNLYAQGQVVAQFANAAARAAAWPAPPAGACSALTDPAAAAGIEQYLAGAWRKPWNLPWGTVAYGERTSDYNLTTALADVLSLTFTALANRYYRLTAFAIGVSGMQASSTGWQIQITDNANAALRRSYGAGQVGVVGGGIPCVLSRATFPAGAVTLKVRANVFGSNGGLVSSTLPEERTYLEVADVGPAGAPA